MMAGFLTYFGHAFGTEFSLPLPLWMFTYAGMAAVVLSFVLAGLLYDGTGRAAKPRTLPLRSRAARRIGQAVSLTLLVLAIVTGFLGNQTPERNFNVTFFWVIVFVGLTYLTVLFGNFWKSINPFRLVALLAERLIGGSWSPVWRYPERLGHAPALAAYFILISLELVFDSFATRPATVSYILLAYVLVSVAGSLAFGAQLWFRYGDFFSVFFRLVGRLSPAAYTKNGVAIRWPFSGLATLQVRDVGLLSFILFMLASTSYDGFTETKQFAQLQAALPDFIGNSGQLYGVVALAGFLATFLVLYVLFVALIERVVRTKMTVRELCYAFAPSLIPIAIGYNIAHYLNYLLLTGQNIIELFSDPFGRGWNLFGTAGYEANTTFLSQYTTWYLQVGAIVIGHVVGVYVAHRIATRIFGKPRVAMVSQLPMVALMVLYTTFSLWIIAQPVYIAQEQAHEERKREQETYQRLREPPMPIRLPDR